MTLSSVKKGIVPSAPFSAKAAATCLTISTFSSDIAYSDRPAALVYGPWLTKAMHCPWFLKSNCSQPPFMHWSFVVGNGCAVDHRDVAGWPVALRAAAEAASNRSVPAPAVRRRRCPAGRRSPGR